MARWLIFPLFIKEIKSILSLFKDKEAPKRYKAVVILGLVYLLSPVDLIPLPIIGLSIVDDIVIWAAILWYLKKPLEKYMGENASRPQKESKPKKKYDGKRVINVEDFTVMDDDKENSEDEE